MAAGLGLLDPSGLLVGTESDGIKIDGVLIEALTTNGAGTSLDGVLIEALTAPDPESTHIDGVLIEALVAPFAGSMAIDGVLIEALVASVPAPEQPTVSNYQSLAEKRFGRDLVVTFADGTVRPTPTGDWPTVAGRPNLHAAAKRRAVTSPTQLVHRPEYGGGLELFTGELNDATERSRMAAQVRENALRDPRLSEVGVAVEAPDEGMVVVSLSVTPIGEIEEDIVQVVGDVS